MEPLSREEKKLIVKNELFLLKEGQYISSKVYQSLVKAHQQFYADLATREQRIKQAEAEEASRIELQQMESSGPGADEFLTTAPEKKLRPQLKQTKSPIPQHEMSLQPDQSKKLKPVTKLSEEQIRERNITWLLNLGVILLLIGGLYVATSNWATMSNLTKAGSIGLISLLFYGIAYVSKRVLNINKTAFAFLVLGSLFLPIFLLSIGWFELIGPYLSIFGEGRYLFGTLSSFIILPIYVLLAKKLSSRLFVWFSYLTLSIGMGFLIASFRTKEDSFFLGMMLFQALLIFFYHRAKLNERFKLFTNEFIYFAQLNLILTTVLMLVLFDSHAYFGFNLILTAIIYLSMVYVTGRKEYHFVFTAMLVFGVFQLVENSFLDHISPIIFAAVGFLFLLIPRALDDQYPWKKIFTWTSGVVSVLAFLVITFEAILINWGNPSFTLMLAYLVISGNFLFLSNTTKKFLFRYLTAIFMSVSFIEGLLLIDKVISLRPFVLYVCLIGFTMLMLGLFVTGKWLELIKQPARDVGWIYMGLSFYVALAIYAWWELGVILLLVSLCALLSLAKEPRAAFKPLAEWLVPLALGFAIAAFGEEIRQASDFYNQDLGVASHFVLASLVLFTAYFISKNHSLRRNHLYVSEAFYSLGLIAAIVFPVNEIWVRPLMFIGGIAMYGKLYDFTKIKYIPYLISTMTLLSYFTVLDSIGEQGNLQFVAGAVLLFAIALIIKNKVLSKGFAVVGHIYLPFAFLLTLFSYGNEAVWSFVIGLIIYAVSTKKVEQEWKRKLFLYSAFSSLFASVASGIAHFDSIDGEFAYLLTSVAIAGFWFVSDSLYKRRTLYYLVPFSLLGVLAFITIYPYEMGAYIVSLLYAIGLLIILHLAKWEILAAIPSLFIYGATLQYLILHSFGAIHESLSLALFGIVFLLAGKWFYHRLYERPFALDVYSIFGVLFFATMYLFEQPTLWIKILPGLLIAAAIWIQRQRIRKEISWIPLFLAGAYLLQPYYVLVSELEIHHLLVRETQILPLVLIGIYLRRCLQGRYEKLTSQLQWAILIIVSIVLVVDGLETSTIYDALILGSLSLASILAGVSLRIKSYFVIGTGVLLLNVFMQTRAYWGNLPWWAYLLIAGTILIAVASSNEWNKQKSARGEATLLGTLKDKVIEMWRQWK